MKLSVQSYIIILCALFISYWGFSQSPTQNEEADSILKVIAQTDNDSIKSKNYQILTRMFAYSDRDKTMKYAHAALKHGQEAENNTEISNSLANFFNVHMALGSEMDTVLNAIGNYENFVKEIGDSAQLAKVYLNYAMYYGRLGQADKDMEYNLKSLDYNRKYWKNKEVELYSLFNIGVTLNEMDQLEKSLSYFEEVMKMDNRTPYLNGKAYFQLGEIYLKLEDIEQSKSYFSQALTIFEKDNNLNEIIKIKIYQGEIKDIEGLFEAGEAHFLEANRLALDNNVKIFIPSTYGSLAQHYYTRNDYKKSIDYGKEYLRLNELMDNYHVDEDILEVLHKSYAKLGLYQEAYKIRDDLATLKDSVLTADHLTSLSEMESTFQVSEQKTKNKLLAAENTIAKNRLRNTQVISIGLLLGLLLAGGWGYSVFRAQQREKLYNETLEATVAERTEDLQIANKNLKQANNELRTFNYIASHDIKEPIRNIGNFIGLIERKLPKDISENLGYSFQMIKRSTSQLYTLIEDFAKYTTLSKDDSIEMTDVDLEFIAQNVCIGLDETIKESNGKVIFEDLPVIPAVNGSLIHVTLKNLVENGLKYNESEEPTVHIKYEEEENSRKIIVEDNGIGIEPQYHEKIFVMLKRLHSRDKYKGSGIGLSIVKLSMEKLNGTITLNSDLGKGSQFILNLPK